MTHPSSPRARRARALAAVLGLLTALAAAPVALAQTVAQKPSKGAAPKPKAPKGDKPAAGKPGKAGAAKPKDNLPPKPDPFEKPAGKAASGQPIELRLNIQRVTLDNGLRVVLNVDRTAPTVAVAVTYDVGSRNEERGRSGFAHLFEHMMFQGSRNVTKGDHFRLVAGHGGQLNGTTNTDRTNYFEMLPANELSLGLWLEADRMRSLDVSQANFENQRKVVQEEYRMRVSNAPYVPSEIRLEELVFHGYWPYEHSTIGSMADLDGAKLEWVKDFHAHHYGPNNAVLTIAGDFDPGEAMAAVHQYFDDIPRVDVRGFNEVQLPEQTSQRTSVVRDDNARTPGVHYGWAIPPARSPDHYALEIASMLLGSGESSRLHQLLVRDKSLARRVSAGTEDRRGPDLFSISAKLSEGAKLADVERAIEAEVKALGAKPPSDAEMEKARRRVLTGLVLGLQSNVARARTLGEYEVYFGDARHLNAELPRYLAVTKDDVKRVAAQYLGPTRRSIVETLPAEHDAGKPKAAKEEKDKGDKGAKKGAEKPAKKADKAAAPAAKPKKKK